MGTTRRCVPFRGAPRVFTGTLASDEPAPTLRHDEKTAPPPGMYWVQMQGLWALRPIVDLDSSCTRTDTGWPESSARSSVEQQGAIWTEANQQRLAQSAGASCSAAALTAAGLPAVEGGTNLERLAVRSQGVIDPRDSYNAEPASSHGGPEQWLEGAAAGRAHAPNLTPPPLPPPPPHQQQGGGSEQQHQGWPSWF